MKTYVVTFSTDGTAELAGTTVTLISIKCYTSAQEVKAEDEEQAVEFVCEDAEIDNLNQYNVIVEDTDGEVD